MHSYLIATMSGSEVQLDPILSIVKDSDGVNNTEKPFLFKMTLDPVKSMQSLLSDDNSNLHNAPPSLLLSKYSCLRDASQALLAYTMDLEKKLAVANAEIDRLKTYAQTPPSLSFPMQPSLLSTQATPDIFTIHSKTVRPRSSDNQRQPSLRTQLNKQKDHEGKQILQHRPYTTFEEIRESVSSRSTSRNSTSSRRASISGPFGTRVPSTKSRASSTSSHALNSTVAGIPSIASVTKGPYPAHASVITNLYRQQNRRSSIKSSTISSKRRTKTHSSCSPRHLSFVSSPASSTHIKRKLRRTKNENSLENIIWAMNGDNKIMKREMATLQEKFENVKATLESFIRMSVDQRENQNKNQNLPEIASLPGPISINQLTDLSVSTPLDTANELHSGETVSIDCSTINPILSTLYKHPTKSYSSTVITSGQHSLVVPPRQAANKNIYDKCSANTLSIQVDMLSDCLLDPQTSHINHEVEDTANIGHSTQSSYLQHIYNASQQQTLEQQNNELREKNKKLKSMLSALKKSFNNGDVLDFIKDNDMLVAKVAELERILFIHEANAARAALTDINASKASIDCSTQTNIYTELIDKECNGTTAYDQKAIQVDPQPSLLHYVTTSINIQTTLTVFDIDLTTNKLLLVEDNLAKAETELIQEREHSFTLRTQLIEARNNALDYLQEASRCKEELTKVNNEVDTLTKENFRINRELLSMDTALDILQAAPATSPLISLGIQTDATTLETDTVIKEETNQDLLANNISLMERVRLLNEELLDASSEKEKALKEATELQKKYDTLHAYAYSQHATYAQLSIEQLSAVSMQQKILSLEEKQRESENTLQKADEIQHAHNALTQELWRITAENEKLSRTNTKLTNDLKDFKRRTSEILKEHLKNTIELEKYRILEEENVSLKNSLERLKDSSNKQFQTIYAEKKELEAIIAELREAKTDDENILLHNAMKLEKRVQSLTLDNKTSVEEIITMRQRVETAEMQLKQTLESLQLASEESRRLQELCSGLQARDLEQNAIISGQQQELQTIQLTFHDEVLGLQARIKELEENRENFLIVTQSLRTERANKESQTLTSPYMIYDASESDRASPTGQNITAHKAVNDIHVKLVLENAHLRQELSKSEQQIKALKDQHSDTNNDHSMYELAHTHKTVECFNIPPQYNESSESYVAHLEKKCEELSADLGRLRLNYQDIEKRHTTVCTQMEHMFRRPDLRVIVRDINGAFLNSIEQHREISDAYETVISQLLQTINDLSNRDSSVTLALSSQDYLTAKNTVSVLQATLRAKEVEVHKLNRMISDLKKANTEILMLAPTNN